MGGKAAAGRVPASPGVLPGLDSRMASYRVLTVVNLWPYPQDPSYGCFVQAQMESLRPLGVEYEVVFINGRLSKWNYVRAFGEVRRRLRQAQFDLVHAHMALSGFAARAQWRVPLVMSFMGNDVLGKHERPGATTLFDYFLRGSSFALARAAQAVIVKSAEMKRRLRLRSAYVIPNGVDAGLFQPMDQRQARSLLGLDADKRYVLFPYDAARGEKRIDLVEAAVALAQAQQPEVTLLQVSGVPQRSLPAYMNACDVLVLASQVEGSPNTVKEAMAVNLPVVARDVGDVKELLEGAEGNYLVAAQPQAMAEKILEVCRSGRRSQSREKALRSFSTRSAAEKIVSVYASVLRPR